MVDLHGRCAAAIPFTVARKWSRVGLVSFLVRFVCVSAWVSIEMKHYHSSNWLSCFPCFMEA
jgi:hypothetical protein